MTHARQGWVRSKPRRIRTAAQWIHGALLVGSLLGFQVTAARSQVALSGLYPTFAPDARSAGMAEAFTAFAEGPTAAFWNPGALGLTLGGAGISAMPFSYRAFVPDYLKEASLYSAAASAAFSGVGIGVDFDRLDFGNQTSNLGSEETSLRLAAGAALSRLFQARAPWLDWGVGATWRHVEVHDKPFRPNPPQDGSVSDLDLGTLVVVHKNVEPRVSSWKSASIAFRVGFVLCNVLDHEVDYPARPSEPLGKHLRFALGLDARLGHVERFGDFLQARFAVETLDVLGKLDLPGPQHRQSYGFEALFLECLAIRYGFHDAENYGLEKDSIGFGVGAHTHRFGGQFDFASVPAPGNLQREEQFTVSGWARF